MKSEQKRGRTHRGPGVAKVRTVEINGQRYNPEVGVPNITIKETEAPMKFGPAIIGVPRAVPPLPVFMSTDSATRKLMPVATGCLNYFPDALLCVSFVSRVGNDKHNPGQPLHWAKEKSTDDPDAEARHMLDFFRGDAPEPGLEQLGELGHLASKAWRALAHLQRACDEQRKKLEGK